MMLSICFPIMQVPKSMYFGEMCECNNFQCGMDMRGKVCSGKGELPWLHGHVCAVPD